MQRLILLLMIALGVSGGVFAAAGEKGITEPPALHIPYGGRVVTDVNISDGDVLGVVKQALPAIADQVKTDLKPLLESISSMNNVRVLVVKYCKNTKAAQIIKQANAGVAKIGRFNRLVMHSEVDAVSIAWYCQEDNCGFVGFVYDSREQTLIAARIVGPIDMAKLIGWASSVGISVASPMIPIAPVPSSEPGKVEERD